MERPSRFASRRERRLWAWAAIVVAAIYSTLWLGSALAEVMYSPVVGTLVFLGAMLLVGLAVLTQGLTIRPRGLEVGVALGVGAAYVMVLLRMTIPERSHLFEYGVVAVLVHEALVERAGQGRRVPVPAVLAVAITSLVGVVDEGLHLFLPRRVFDPEDILFNVLASLMAVGAMVALGWARRVVARRDRQRSASLHPGDTGGAP